MDRYLSVEDVHKIADKPFNVVKFGDIKKYDNIYDLFVPSTLGMRYAPVDDVLILYELKKNSGHWCVLKRIPKGKYKYSYHFLDSYGDVIDNQRKYINPEFRKVSGQNSPNILEQLFDNRETDIHYNDKKLQQDGYSTCGRYAGLFIRFNEPVEKFVSNLKKFAKLEKMNIDDTVIALTEPLLRSLFDENSPSIE